MAAFVLHAQRQTRVRAAPAARGARKWGTDRPLLLLYMLDGHSTVEAAEEFGRTEQAIWSQLTHPSGALFRTRDDSHSAVFVDLEGGGRALHQVGGNYAVMRRGEMAPFTREGMISLFGERAGLLAPTVEGDA